MNIKYLEEFQIVEGITLKDARNLFKAKCKDLKLQHFQMKEITFINKLKEKCNDRIFSLPEFSLGYYSAQAI